LDVKFASNFVPTRQLNLMRDVASQSSMKRFAKDAAAVQPIAPAELPVAAIFRADRFLQKLMAF
jgi:hypothetical protein